MTLPIDVPLQLPQPRTPDPHEAPAIRWGIIAPGGIAHTFAEAVTVGTASRVVAVGSRSSERARDFADEFAIQTAYGSYEELVADDDVDAVYVASPHSEHRDHALLAIEAGKPVLVEKAFARNAAEARQVMLAAEARGLLVMEAMWSCFLPHYDVVRHVVESGLIGDIVAVFADHGQCLYPDGPARLAQPELAGGALLDLGVYPVAFADLVLGAPERLTATGTLTDLGVDATTTITVTGAGGAARRALLHDGRSHSRHRGHRWHRGAARAERSLLRCGLGHPARQPGQRGDRRARRRPTRGSARILLRGSRVRALPPLLARPSRRSCPTPPPCGSWRRWTRCVARSASPIRASEPPGLLDRTHPQVGLTSPSQGDVAGHLLKRQSAMRRRSALLLALAITLPGLAACSGDGSITRPTSVPSISGSVSAPAITLPTLTRTTVPDATRTSEAETPEPPPAETVTRTRRAPRRPPRP